MSRYDPGTLNDELVNARVRRKRQQTLNSVCQPTGSQAYGLLEKFQSFNADLSDIKQIAEEALSIAKNSVPPVGTVISTISKIDPKDIGYPGVWKFLTRGQIPMTKFALYFYERIE